MMVNRNGSSGKKSNGGGVVVLKLSLSVRIVLMAINSMHDCSPRCVFLLSAAHPEEVVVDVAATATATARTTTTACFFCFQKAVLRLEATSRLKVGPLALGKSRVALHTDRFCKNFSRAKTCCHCLSYELLT